MKKLLVLTMLIFSVTCMNAQNYGSWVLPFENSSLNHACQMKFGQDQVSFNQLKQYPAGSYLYSAGGYDQYGNFLFYFTDKEVFDATSTPNTSIGNFHLNEEDEIWPEVQVINKPGDNLTFYIIYSAYPPTDIDPAFYYSEVLIDPITKEPSMGNIEVYIEDYNQYGAGGFAISEIANGQRKLYRCTQANGITESSITSSGFLDDAVQLLPPDNSTIGADHNFASYNFEMKVNNTGHTIFAWVTHQSNTYASDMDKVFIYNKDVSSNAVKKIDVDPNTVGTIGGIEFSNFDDDIIYVSYNTESTGSGIIALDYVNETTTMLTTGDYSHTGLQHAPDGHIYGVSDDGSDFCKIDDIIGGSFTTGLSNGEMLCYYTWPSGLIKYYILPENEKTILNLNVEPVNIACEGLTDGSAEAIAFGGVPPYEYLWMDSDGDEIGDEQSITGLGVGTYTCEITDSDFPPTIIEETFLIVIDNSLLPFTFPDEEEVIHYNPLNTVTTWWEPIASFEIGIRIESGQTLIIPSGSYLEFGEGAKIIVEPGATLEVNGSTLSYFAYCPFRWQGIEVWGDPDESQIIDPNDGIQWQGKLILNDAVIEHAVVAVGLTRPGTWNTYEGGIVQATDSEFKNNHRAVHAVNFINRHPWTERIIDNVSWFKYCTFDINSNYMPDVLFHKHADLAQVDGIEFRACNFSLQTGVNGVSQWNQAIAAYSAGFDITSGCSSAQSPCPDEYTDKSVFTGFYKGIHADDIYFLNYVFTVERSEFNNNATGIYSNGIDYVSVLYTDFYIGNNFNNQDECADGGLKSSSYGIDLFAGDGFIIEENKFAIMQGASGGDFVGIRLNDTYSNSDDVYRNRFSGLIKGNLAVGENRSDPEDDAFGVSYICNENSRNSYDIHVANLSTIRGNIGETSNPSGNVLTDPAYSVKQVQNDYTQDVQYYYNENETDEWLTEYSSYVYAFDIDAENTCPENYGGGSSGGTIGKSLVLTPEQKLDAETEYYESYTDYNNVEALYNDLKDGGDTEAMQAEIETAWPSDMWELRSQLLGESPHLSLEVLKAASDKIEVLPDNVIFEILSANPDELRNEELISHLENKDQPLPQYMINILQELADGITYKTILQNQMSEYNHKKVSAAQDIIRSILNEDELDYTALRNWLDNIGGMVSDKKIISTYLQERDYTSAQSLLNMLPSLYDLTGEDLLAYNDYKTFIELQITLAQEDRNILELDEDELNTVIYLSENGKGNSRHMARGILESAYGYSYCNCEIIPNTEGQKSSHVSYDDLTSAMGLQVTAEPNPATAYVTFSYQFPINESTGTITITDVNGKEAGRFNINGELGQNTWDTRKIKPGVYIYKIETQTMSKKGKLIIK